MPIDTLDRLLTPTEASRLCDLSAHRISELGKLGKLPYVPVGNKRAFRERDIRDLAERRKRAQQAAG